MNLNIGDILLGVLFTIPWYIFLFIPGVLIFTYYQTKAKRYLYSKIHIDKKVAYKKYKSKNRINADRKIKGDNYEAHICKYYEEQGYLTVPHGKDNGVKDQGIDIILKKDKKILFIQCKDWNINNKYRIDSKEIQYTRMNVRDYMQKNQVFSMYEWKILYVTSDNILDRGAQQKIREYSNEIEHKIII